MVDPFEIKKQTKTNPYAPMTEKEMLEKLENSREQGVFRDADLVISDMRSKYHNLIIGILELLFYPNLSSPRKEKDIHAGRKRIDIVFDNSSETGFFFNLPNKNILLPCPYVYVECKNYTGEVANPEIDQLSGRFSNRRGRIGILTCRELEDNFIKRCADTYEDERGLVIPLEDKDLKQALMNYPQHGVEAIEEIISKKFEQIVFTK